MIQRTTGFSKMVADKPSCVQGSCQWKQLVGSCCRTAYVPAACLKCHVHRAIAAYQRYLAHRVLADSLRSPVRPAASAAPRPQVRLSF